MPDSPTICDGQGSLCGALLSEGLEVVYWRSGVAFLRRLEVGPPTREQAHLMGEACEGRFGDNTADQPPFSGGWVHPPRGTP